MSSKKAVFDVDGNDVEKAVEVVEEEVEEIVAKMYVSELTVDEFRQLMNEVLDARKPQKKAASKVVAPEGYTRTIADVQELLGVGSMRVRAMCRDGKFGEDGAVKVNGRWFIMPEAVVAYAEASKITKATKAEAKKAKTAKAKRTEVKAAKAAAANIEAKAIKVKLDALEEKFAAEDALDLDELDLIDGETAEVEVIDADTE